MRAFRAAKEPYILERAARARAILHVGCTGAPNTQKRWAAGTLLHKNLCDRRAGDQRVVGIDIEEESLAWLRQRMPREEILYADAHALDEHLGGARFDLVIAGDVIEHLPNPGQFLTSCRSVLAGDGALLVTTVNAYGIARFAKAFFNHEAVHPEHTAYFSHRTLARLLGMSGYEVARLGYYTCKPIVGKAPIARYAGNAVEHLFAPVWPQFSEGVIVEARAAR